MKAFQKVDLPESVGALLGRVKDAFVRGAQTEQVLAEKILAADLEEQTDGMLERTVEFWKSRRDNEVDG
jgi:hypothetical protein